MDTLNVCLIDPTPFPRGLKEIMPYVRDGVIFFEGTWSLRQDFSPYDVMLVTDLDGNGAKFIRALRDEHIPHPPIIGMSVGTWGKESMLEAGAIAFWEKDTIPSQIEVLISLMLQAIESRT